MLTLEMHDFWIENDPKFFAGIDAVYAEAKLIIIRLVFFHKLLHCCNVLGRHYAVSFFILSAGSYTEFQLVSFSTKKNPNRSLL